MKRFLLIILICYHFPVAGQIDADRGSNGVVFNPRTELLEVVSIIEFNNIDKDTIFQRAIKWFDSKYKKYNDKKFDNRLCYRNPYDSVELKIIGRYADLYPLGRKPNKKLLLISCTVEIQIRDNRARIILTSYMLPDFQFVTLEEMALDQDRSFRRQFRRLDKNINEKADALIENLHNWIENFEPLTRQHLHW